MNSEKSSVTLRWPEQLTDVFVSVGPGCELLQLKQAALNHLIKSWMSQPSPSMSDPACQRQTSQYY